MRRGPLAVDRQHHAGRQPQAELDDAVADPEVAHVPLGRQLRQHGLEDRLARGPLGLGAGDDRLEPADRLGGPHVQVLPGAGTRLQLGEILLGAGEPVADRGGSLHEAPRQGVGPGQPGPERRNALVDLRLPLLDLQHPLGESPQLEPDVAHGRRHRLEARELLAQHRHLGLPLLDGLRELLQRRRQIAARNWPPGEEGDHHGQRDQRGQRGRTQRPGEDARCGQLHEVVSSIAKSLPVRWGPAGRPMLARAGRGEGATARLPTPRARL